MTEHAALVPGETVDVDTVKPGDEILVGRRKGYHLVSSIDRYDDGAIVVVYFDEEESTYENKARDHSGYNRRRVLCEKSLRPLQPGEPVTVIRGSVGAAETVRDRMHREQNERWAVRQSKIDRAEARRADG